MPQQIGHYQACLVAPLGVHRRELKADSLQPPRETFTLESVAHDGQTLEQACEIMLGARLINEPFEYRKMGGAYGS